jgi:predicted transcriptional regulator
METTLNLKNQLHTMIDLIKDESILNAIYTLLKKEWEVEEMYVTVSEAELQAIDEGLAQLENGEEYEHAEAEKIYKLWQ